MQKNISNNRNISRGKFLVRYCILFIVGITFFLQQVQAFFVSHNSANAIIGTPGYTVQKKKLNVYDSFVSELQLTPSVVDMELENSEEDETENNEKELFSVTDTHALIELKYTCFLQSLYLHLHSSVQQQNLVPFFILYHSWKEDITCSIVC